MIIPDKIRIGGQDISVVKEERLDDNKLGTIPLSEKIKNKQEKQMNILKL